MTKRSWKDLSPRARKGLAVLGGIEAALAIAAEVDLARRPDALVSGSKARWRLLIMVNFVGPIAYFLRGRRTAPAS